MYPFLKKLFADGGYQGPEFHTALTKLLPQLDTEIIKRSDHAKGFVVLPRRSRPAKLRRGKKFTKLFQANAGNQSFACALMALLALLFQINEFKGAS